MGCLFGEGPQKRVARLSYLFERGHVTSPLDQFKGCSGCESGVQLGSMGSSISSS